MSPTIDPKLIAAWVEGRSLARGLPPPEPDRGGWRVDTNAGGEVRRWVFPRVGPGIAEVARGLDRPGHLIKACGRVEELAALLPAGWRVEATGYLMRMVAPWGARRALAPGYALDVQGGGAVAQVRILSGTGEVAASGHAAETGRAFVYDRIATAPGHRRRGLGGVLMTELHAARRRPEVPELLVATEEGRALYRSLGWEVLSPYLTACIPGGKA